YPRGTGGVLSFELDTDITGVQRLFDSLKLFKIAANLGDARSMAVHPAWTTHCRLTPELAKAGEITEYTVRLASGREAVQDLWADHQASMDLIRTATAPVLAQKVSA